MGGQDGMGGEGGGFMGGCSGGDGAGQTRKTRLFTFVWGERCGGVKVGPEAYVRQRVHLQDGDLVAWLWMHLSVHQPMT